MKLDVLAFGAHPDDVELSCAGTLASQIDIGLKCGIVDLSRGELGTRGTAETRLQEAEAAAKALGVEVRENLGFMDGFFKNDREHQLAVVHVIRKYQPEIVMANAPSDRHPDHGRAAELVKEAAFLAGLRMISTEENGQEQEAYRPQLLLHYIQFQNLKPNFIVPFNQTALEKKLAAIRAYRSQFYNPDSKEPETVISSENFLDSVEYRARDMGRLIGRDFGEGFISSADLGVTDLRSLCGVR